MHCRTCDYPLWNLKARQCPECGTGFVPSQFDFVPSSVQFCCPHCGQSYYGTGARGHLVPPEFACVRCGERIAMDQMVLLPSAGLDERQTRVDTVPWYDRDQRGFFRGWLSTLGWAMAMPGRLARALPAQPAVLSSWWFAVLTQVAVHAVCAVPILVLLLVMAGAAGPRRGMPPAVAVVSSSAMVLIPAVAAALLVFPWALTAHGVLRVTGPVQRGVRHSMVALCFSSGANVLVALPCVGFYLGMLSWIWWAISAAIMLRAVHGVSGGRATLAVLAFPLALIAVCAVWIGIAMSSASSAMASARLAASAMQSTIPATAKMVTGLRQAAAANAGAPPAHALALLQDGGVFASDFFASGVPGTPADDLILDQSLTSFRALPAPQRRDVVAQAAAALPPGAAEHRVGDFVFVYGGITFPPGGAPDPGVWLVVNVPSGSAVQRGSVGAGVITVGTIDGTYQIPVSLFQRRLAEQNALRTSLGLPIIPDPRTVQQQSHITSGD